MRLLEPTAIANETAPQPVHAAARVHPAQATTAMPPSSATVAAAGATTLRRPLSRAAGALPEGLLRAHPLLAGLDAAALDALAAGARMVTLRRGDALVTRGTRLDGIGWIVEGTAEVFPEHDGRELLLDVVRCGDLVGALSMVDGAAEPVTWRAAGALRMVVLSAAALEPFMRHPHLMRALSTWVSGKIRRTIRRAHALALEPVQERLLWQLIDLGVPIDAGRWRITGRVNRTKIALLIAASREMVSRGMSQLTASGVLQTLADGSLIVEPARARPTTN